VRASPRGRRGEVARSSVRVSSEAQVTRAVWTVPREDAVAVAARIGAELERGAQTGYPGPVGSRVTVLCFARLRTGGVRPK
jgi:hypothetical protein